MVRDGEFVTADFHITEMITNFDNSKVNEEVVHESIAKNDDHDRALEEVPAHGDDVEEDQELGQVQHEGSGLLEVREGGGGRRGGRVSSSRMFSPLHIVTYSLTHQLLAVVATITFSIVAKGGDGGESTGAEKKGGRDEEKEEEEGKVGEEQRESEEGKGGEEKEEREEEGKGGEEAEEKDEEAKGWEDVGMETAGDGEEKLVEDENVLCRGLQGRKVHRI